MPSASDQALIERYLAHARHEKRLAERSLTLYARALAQLTRLADASAPPTALTAVRADQVRHWMSRMHAAGAAPRSLALTLSGWRGFYTWLGRQRLVPSNPVQGIRPPRSPRRLPKALPVDETVRLAEAVIESDSPWQQARDAALFELLYGCGLRVSELAGLNLAASDRAWQSGQGWIDLAETQAHVYGKGSKRRSVPLGRPALAALRAWLKERASVAPADEDAACALFISTRGRRMSVRSVQQRIKRRGQLLGASMSLHPHMLRHSFASHLLQSSQDLRGVQELMGHASIKATQVYTHLDFQHLAAVYDQTHPRGKRRAR